MSLKCSRCSYEPFDGDSFCRECGEEFETFECDCGAEVFSEDKFCHSCGAELSDSAEESAPEQPIQQPIQPQPQQPSPPPQQPGNFNQNQFNRPY